MKKITFLLLLSLFSFGVASAQQNLKLHHFPDTIWYNPAVSYDMHGVIENESNFTVPTMVVRTKNDLATGHLTQFCFGPQCYDDATDSTKFPYDIDSHYYDSTFKLTLIPSGNIGVTTVTMLFYNFNERNDSIAHSIVFINDPSAGIDADDLAAGFRLDKPVPNPASDFTTINYQLPQATTHARLEVLSLQGQVLQSQFVSTIQSDVQLNVSGMSGGLYMVRLIADERTIGTVRLMVK